MGFGWGRFVFPVFLIIFSIALYKGKKFFSQAANYSLGAVLYAQFLSEQLDLIATGGSDFHRLEEGNYLMEKSWDWFKIDSKYLRKIDKIIK